MKSFMDGRELYLEEKALAEGDYTMEGPIHLRIWKRLGKGENT